MNSGPQLTRAGFVIAGGKSSRMGTDKAFLDFSGQTLLERALATLRAVCDEATIVGNPTAFAGYGPVVADVFPGCGPLGGIHAALLRSSAELNLMLAVDMPFVSQGLLRFLFEMAENCGAIVTVPRTGDGLQPLCAVYRRDFAHIAEQALKAGKCKIDATFTNVALRVIEEAELAGAGFSETKFFNVNTLEDRRTAESFLP
ncbi:MAG: molybdenum cofactor guanylyltransferase [Terriglobales bacterium]|jgi:molybdopterin-guanine dinucleotide biosynthesis protein A